VHTSPPMSVARWSVCFGCVLGRFWRLCGRFGPTLFVRMAGYPLRLAGLPYQAAAI